MQIEYYVIVYSGTTSPKHKFTYKYLVLASAVVHLGDMKELGSEELALHYNTGKYAAEKGVDLVLCVGELAKELAKGADGLWYESIEALCKDLPKLLRGGDTVLVKASHSMQFEKITEFLKEF